MRILFLCTGNAARSQMAEAIANAFYAGRLEAVSCGSKPTGWVHPLAVQAMSELGVDISHARSKPASEFLDQEFDAVITLCDLASKDCPSWPGAKRIEHWSIKDPSYGPDDPATRYERFLRTRRELQSRIADFAARMFPGD